MSSSLERFRVPSTCACPRRAAALVARLAIASALLATSASAAEPRRGDWTMWGGRPDRNMRSDETGIAAEWDVKSGKNILWKAPLGSQTYGNPVISGGKVLVGTNNDGGFRPGITGDKGVVLCFDEKTGKLLWQMTHDKLPTGRVNDWPQQGICSAPVVEGDRAYYVSNRAEVVCIDIDGFADGNDGPVTDEPYSEPMDGDVVWSFDMIEELAVFPHNLATSSPLIAGDLVLLVTSNGVDEGHLNLPAPTAPAFIAVNKKTGELAWEAKVEHRVLHGQWSSPAYGVIGGVPQAVFAGGDGWVYGLDPQTGERLWMFDMNPKGSEYILGGRGTRSYIIATPVIHNDRVYLCVGQDPEHGEGVGHLRCIDATKRGDITESGQVWHVGNDQFNRSLSTCAIADGLLYAADLSGFLYCLNADTGERHWRYDTFSALWGSPFVVDGRVMLGTEEGDVVIMQHGKEEKLLGKYEMGSSVYTTPVVSNGVLYITSKNMLYAIRPGAQLATPQ